MARQAGDHNSNTSGRRDIWLLAIIATIIVGATIFVSFKLLDQSERHVEAVKDMKVTENVDNAWAPQAKLVDTMVKSDYESNPDRTEAKYANLQITESTMVYIAKMHNLRRLNLSACSLNDGWLKYLENLPLQHIALSHCDITDDGMKHLAKIRTLKNLHINGCVRVGNRGMAAIKALPITELHIARTGITNNGVKHLTALNKLIKLDISENKLTSSALVDLADLNELLSLSIAGVPIETKDLETYLNRSPKIWALNLTRCGINDEGVKALASKVQLRKLIICENPFTSKGVSYLCANPTLAVLRIDDCPNITNDDVKRLRKSNPNCRIELTDRKQENLKDAVTEFF